MLHAEASSSEEKSAPKRVVALNNPVENAKQVFPSNRTSTTKYNIFTFLPKNIFEQFRRYVFLLALSFVNAVVRRFYLSFDLGINPGAFSAFDLLSLILSFRFANFYFLLVVLIELIPGVSPLTPLASIFPLAFVVGVTAIKDAYEDIVSPVLLS